MWKSASSISKVCGKGGKNSFIVFPCFPQTGISTACFGRGDFSTAFGRPQFLRLFFNPAHAKVALCAVSPGPT
jgi:hypothetical protein